MLPYTLRWKFKVTETNRPFGFSLEAVGDFVGKGNWKFNQLNEKQCKVIYDWMIDAEKPLLKNIIFIMKPVFSFNHHWAMRRGKKSIKLELLKRKLKTEAEKTHVAAPAQPTFPHDITYNKIL